jgi:ribonuclease BN (tRNA processing enzyme)
MLTLTFLGVGSAFSKRNFHSNALIEIWKQGPDHQDEPDDTLLIDFGGEGPIALYELSKMPGFHYLGINGNINYPKIKRIFVTHQHTDHIGGLEELALMNMYVYKDPLTGRGHKSQILSSIKILVNLWDNSLKGGLSTMPGRYTLMQDFFFIQALRQSGEEAGQFTLGKRYRFEAFPTDHIQIERKYDWPSYGLFVTDTQSGECMFFSGDTRFDYSAYSAMLSKAKTIFHDCQLIEQKEPVHAMISELRTMPADIKKRTHLYHYEDIFDSGPFGFVNEEFAGFAKPKHRYVIFQ